MDTEIMSEIDTLKERADQMGIPYHPSIGLEKLREKVNARLNGTPETEAETVMQQQEKARKKANKLVRIRISNMNPAKKAWPGEIISVSNDIIGCVKKYIPFNAENGWHVPQVLLGVLNDRVYPAYYAVTVNGQSVKRRKLLKEFSIEILPNLTKAELLELAKTQAQNKDVDIK